MSFQYGGPYYCSDTWTGSDLKMLCLFFSSKALIYYSLLLLLCLIYILKLQNENCLRLPQITKLTRRVVV